MHAFIFCYIPPAQKQSNKHHCRDNPHIHGDVFSQAVQQQMNSVVTVDVCPNMLGPKGGQITECLDK